MFKIYAVSQAGSMHSCNEDRAIINGSVLHSGEVEQWCDRSELTVAIFDGVGGEQGGSSLHICRKKNCRAGIKCK